MKDQLQQLFDQAITSLKNDSIIPADHEVTLSFERTRQKEHGDLACNAAMTLAKIARKNPRELAQILVDALPESTLIARTEIAGPGFINVFLANEAKTACLPTIFQQGDHYGLATPESGDKILVEFVSANPTGPLHVGHGRGAAYGDALARLLRAAGHTVEKEYYVNDAGRQMDILAISVWIRYLQIVGNDIALPSKAYQGEYVTQLAHDLAAEHKEKYNVTLDELSAIESDLDDEQQLDAIIQIAKSALREDGYSLFFNAALNANLQDIRQDLSEFGVDFDTWYSERSLFTSDKISSTIDVLKASGDVYQKDGTWWFRTTAYGDEKDRVVIRENGQPTYFASDIAYHKDKLDRGFDLIIDIWGSDHHGYIARVKAALTALGFDEARLKVLLVQFAVLYQNGEKVSMGTRAGKFVTLRQLRNDVGSDAARFFYAQRKSEQHMDFDLDLAKSQSNENPMYYVQYAHARICQLFKQATERNIDTNEIHQADFSLLNNQHQNELVGLLQRFPESVERAARDFEPHQIAYYLRDLATAFHAYYNTSKFLDTTKGERDAILGLCDATRQVLKNGLTILGVGAPQSM